MTDLLKTSDVQNLNVNVSQCSVKRNGGGGGEGVHITSPMNLIEHFDTVMGPLD